jgi:hypothetical protein
MNRFTKKRKKKKENPKKKAKKLSHCVYLPVDPDNEKGKKEPYFSLNYLNGYVAIASNLEEFMLPGMELAPRSEEFALGWNNALHYIHSLMNDDSMNDDLMKDATEDLSH